MPSVSRVVREMSSHSNRHATSTSTLSGARSLAVPREVTAQAEQFEAPDPELFSMVDRAMKVTAHDVELAKARELLAERDRTIAVLEERLLTARSDLAKALAELRARQGELNELESLLLPAPLNREPKADEPAASAPTERSGITQIPESLRIKVEAQPEPKPELKPEPKSVPKPVSPTLLHVWVAPAGCSNSLPPPSIREPGRADAAARESMPFPTRRDSRPPGAFEVEFVEETEFFATSETMIIDGLFVATYRTFPVGTELELGVQLSNGKHLRAQAEVRWLRPAGDPETARPGLGLAFHELSSQAQLLIGEFASARAPIYMEF